MGLWSSNEWNNWRESDFYFVLDLLYRQQFYMGRHETALILIHRFCEMDPNNVTSISVTR
jgi:hypothetical protein